MSSTNVIGEEVSGGEQADEWIESESVELRPSVEQEIQATVDLNDSGSEFEGLTLAEEERLEARAWEIERTSVRFDRRQTSDREARTRTVAATVSTERRREFGERAACVDRWAGIDGDDPRELVTQEELGEINHEAARLAKKLPRWSRAAISRRLAERVVDGVGITEFEVEADVILGLFVYLGHVTFDGLPRVGGVVEFLVLNVDAFDGAPRSVFRLRDNGRDAVALMAHLLQRENPVLRLNEIGEIPRGRDGVWNPTVLDVFASEHGDNTVHRFRFAGIDVDDSRMGVIRPTDSEMRHPREGDVVGERCFTLQERNILATLDRRSEHALGDIFAVAHSLSPSWSAVASMASTML